MGVVLAAAALAGPSEPQPGPDGQLSLLVRPGAADGGAPEVLLSNRTPSAVSLSFQDGDPYLRLQVEVAPGKWVRAQEHFPSWCGNSYYQRDLAPGRSFRYVGYQPREGRVARVRYVLEQQSFELASETFQGRVSDEDIARAAVDSQAIALGDVALVEPIAMGERPVEWRNHMDPRRRAVARLVVLTEQGDLDALRALRRVATLPADDAPEHGQTYGEFALAQLERLGKAPASWFR